MTSVVRLYNPSVIGQVVSQMAYGAIVSYTDGGIDFMEMLSNEDYEVLFDLDEILEELANE